MQCTHLYAYYFVCFSLCVCERECFFMHTLKCLSSFRSKIIIFFHPPASTSHKLYAYTHKIYSWCSLFFTPLCWHQENLHHIVFFLLSSFWWLFHLVYFNSNTRCTAIGWESKKKVYYVFLTSHPGIGFPKNFHFEKDAWKKWALQCARRKRKKEEEKKTTTKHKTSIVMSSLFSLCIRLVIFLSLSPFWLWLGLMKIFKWKLLLISQSVCVCVFCRFSFRFV